MYFSCTIHLLSNHFNDLIFLIEENMYPLGNPVFLIYVNKYNPVFFPMEFFETSSQLTQDVPDETKYNIFSVFIDLKDPKDKLQIDIKDIPNEQQKTNFQSQPNFSQLKLRYLTSNLDLVGFFDNNNDLTKSDTPLKTYRCTQTP